jgi:subtilisin family serine protease
MQVPELHNRGLTGNNVTIAILDTGFDITHPAVVNTKIQAMIDFVSSTLAIQLTPN